MQELLKSLNSLKNKLNKLTTVDTPSVKQSTNGRVQLGVSLNSKFKSIVIDRSLGKSQLGILSKAIKKLSNRDLSTNNHRFRIYTDRQDVFKFVLDIPVSLQEEITRLSKEHNLYKYEVIQIALLKLSKSTKGV